MQRAPSFDFGVPRKPSDFTEAIVIAGFAISTGHNHALGSVSVHGWALLMTMEPIVDAVVSELLCTHDLRPRIARAGEDLSAHCF